MKILHPNVVALRTVLLFLQDIFEYNYEQGNWYMNPEKEMYIREEYPQDLKKTGIKPGVVLDEYGGIRRAVEFLGSHGFKPMRRRNLNQYHMNQEVWQGNLILKVISENESEAEQLGYLTIHSINQYIDHLLGRHGLIWVNANRVSEAKPYKVSSEYKTWACDIQLEFVIANDYHRHFISGTKLEELDIVAEFQTYENDSGVGTGVEQRHSGMQEEHNQGVSVYKQVLDNTTEDTDVGITVSAKAKDILEEHLEAGVLVEQEFSYKPEEHLDAEVLVKRAEVDQLEYMPARTPLYDHIPVSTIDYSEESTLEDIPGGSYDLDSTNEGILNSIFVVPKDEDKEYTIKLYIDGVLEYQTQAVGTSYDVTNQVFICDNSMRLVLPEDMEFEKARVTTFKIDGVYEENDDFTLNNGILSNIYIIPKDDTQSYDVEILVDGETEYIRSNITGILYDITNQHISGDVEIKLSDIDYEMVRIRGLKF